MVEAKRYLNQIRLLDTRINQKIRERTDLYASIFGGRSSSNINPDKVQSSIDLHKDEALIVKCADLEREINSMIDRLVSLRHKIIDEIHLVEDPNQVDCLYQRYVEYCTFEQIAINTGYSIRRIYQIHNNALLAFSEKVKDCI